MGCFAAAADATTKLLHSELGNEEQKGKLDQERYELLCGFLELFFQRLKKSVIMNYPYSK